MKLTSETVSPVLTLEYIGDVVSECYSSRAPSAVEAGYPARGYQTGKHLKQVEQVTSAFKCFCWRKDVQPSSEP